MAGGENLTSPPYRHLELCGIALIIFLTAKPAPGRVLAVRGGLVFLRGLTANYTRVLSTSCSGTGASIERGTPSTHWMAFFGHLETQVPQPLHLV